VAEARELGQPQISPEPYTVMGKWERETMDMEKMPIFPLPSKHSYFLLKVLSLFPFPEKETRGGVRTGLEEE